MHLGGLRRSCMQIFSYMPGCCVLCAARTPGFTVGARDASKRRVYRQVSSGLPFVPFESVDSFRRLEAPALTLLGDLAVQAGCIDKYFCLCIPQRM
jgi:hypothetical protein